MANQKLVIVESPTKAKTIGKYLGRGYRVKVAVIASGADLGAIPSLFGKPTEYSRFLGVELSMYYVGPLLIVMPAGPTTEATDFTIMFTPALVGQ